jgi:hypothetical protein
VGLDVFPTPQEPRHGYCSLVDRRCCDFIHWPRTASEYRMALPILMNGGPSPRMRALASHDTLTFRSLAASLGVSRNKAGAAGL